MDQPYRHVLDCVSRSAPWVPNIKFVLFCFFILFSFVTCIVFNFHLCLHMMAGWWHCIRDLSDWQSNWISFRLLMIFQLLDGFSTRRGGRSFWPPVMFKHELILDHWPNLEKLLSSNNYASFDPLRSNLTPLPMWFYGLTWWQGDVRCLPLKRLRLSWPGWLNLHRHLRWRCPRV